MDASYSDLAEALANISQIRAQDEESRRQEGGNSLPWQEAYHEHLAKMWRGYAGMGLSRNKFGVAPQILDNQQNIAWMQSALQDPHGIGQNAPGPRGLLHTPKQYTEDEGSRTSRLSPEEAYRKQSLQRYGYNSNTDQPNNWNSNTGMPAGYNSNTGGWGNYGTSDPRVEHLINQLAQNPQHASNQREYMAMAGQQSYNPPGASEEYGYEV